MNNDSDRKTFKLKKNPKRNKKENDSNSSRESLEMEIRSYKQNKKISQKKTGEGEEIKFFFNEPPQSPEKKNSKFKINHISSTRTFPKPNFKLSKGKDDFNFKDILLNYVNSPERQTKTKKDEKVDKRSSVIYGNPETVLTLNGDENSNDSEIKEKNENCESSQNSKTESKSNSNSAEISSNNEEISKKSEHKKEKSKKEITKESSYKSKNTSKYEDSSKTPSNSNISIKNNDIEEDNEKKEINNNEILKKEEKSNENNKISEKDIKKLASFESNIQKSNKDSCFNSYKNSLNYKNSNSNTFTTATNTQNTHNTHNTHNSSFKSLKINNKKLNYNYLCWNDLSLHKKLIIQNRNNSVKKVINLKEIVKNNFIKDENTSIMLYKLKNLNISLDIEKSYSCHFKYLTNLQNQKSHYKNKSSENISSSNNQTNRLYEKNSENSFYYPDEYYINKENNLHKKSHVSNLFDKLREYKHNS